jgi:hypothetical protein
MTVAECYEILNLQPGASIEEIDFAFSNQRISLVKAGRKSAIAELTTAYHECRDRTLNENAAVLTAAETDLPDRQIATYLDRLLYKQGIRSIVQIVGRELQVELQSKSATIKPQVAIQVIKCLQVLDPVGVETVVIYQLRAKSITGWKQTFQIDETIKSADTDLYSFDNRYVNRWALPIAFAFALLAQVLVFPRFLLVGVKIWIHEFGHATVAWLSGHGATPLPFGWTNIAEDRSPIVYICFLLLVLLFGWSGLRENKRGITIMAGVIAIVQFYMTWLMPEYIYDILISFGGIGGEFYLSTLLIVCFYLPLPDRFRWDFWRFLFLSMAAFTFAESFGMWHQIKAGTADIPWGTMLGGQGDAGGDMNNLIAFGWSNAQIINTYSQLGNLCLFVIIGVYTVFCLRSLQSHNWLKIWK